MTDWVKKIANEVQKPLSSYDKSAIQMGIDGAITEAEQAMKERAAKVAETLFEHAIEHTHHKIAAAIRALGKE